MSPITPIKVLHFQGDARETECVCATLNGMEIPCEFARAGSPQEYYDALSRGGYDVIVSDFDLPGYDGVMALTLAREMRPDLPFIYYAGAAGDEKVAEVIRLGAADYVLKDRVNRLGLAIVRTVGASRTARDRRLVEEQFIQAQKMEAMGQLAAGVAHDFNNILTVVLSYGRFVLEALPPDHAARADAEEVLKAGERGAALVRQLLAFGRKQITEPRETDINEAITSMVRMLRRLIGEHVALVLDLDPAAGFALVDPTHLVQVLVNLSVNARDAMHGGGTLTVRTAREASPAGGGDERVRVTVADTGTGIPREIMPRIFEPFFTTKGKGKGTGLGLAMVHGSVIQNGGSIDVESEPGKGAAFHIRLLRVARLGNGDDDPAGAAPRGRGETVLVVEDEEGVREVVRRILSGSGYEVVEAKDGDEALLKFVEHAGKVALVLTDVIMPGMGGAQLGGKLAGIRPGVRIIYTTGYTDEMLQAQGALGPGATVLTKPIDRYTLLRRVRETLDGRR